VKWSIWTQGFAEGNERTALLAARWTLDRNGIDGASLVPAHDPEVADVAREIPIRHTLGQLRREAEAIPQAG
jgi:hypothetical protein